MSRLIKIHTKNTLVTRSVTTLCAICWAYALTARYTHFFLAPRLEKMLLLIAAVSVISLLTFIIFYKVKPIDLDAPSSRSTRNLVAASFLMTVFLFCFFYRFPHFPENHVLEIQPQIDPTHQAARGELEIISIERVELPGGAQSAVPPERMVITGFNQLSADSDRLTWTGDPNASIRFERLMQAGMLVTFRVGPRQGQVVLNWDAEKYSLDLYAPIESLRFVRLMPAQDLQNTLPSQNFLLLLALVADFAGLFFLIAIILSLVFPIFSTNKTRPQPARVILACVLLFSILWPLLSQLDPITHFQDSNLENAVRLTLQQPDGPIRQHKLLTIASLDASNHEITSLEGIQQLRNLASLNLRDNFITDLSPLAALPRLRDLGLRNNAVSNLQPLSRLSNLESLNLRDNVISGISPLAALSSLRDLNLRSNAVKDLQPLSQLPNLVELNLGSNHIQNLSPLLTLSDLTYLNLRDNYLHDISPLSNLTKLQSLNLGGNTNISSITPLANLTDLRSLNLRNVPLGSQVELLSRFTNLSRLNLRNANISDIAPLASLMASGTLQSSLDIRDNPIPRQPADGYAALRHFWDAIPLRAPFSLPVFNTLPDPSFSHSGGFYLQPFSLSISSSIPQAAIHYTLDGSEPTPDSPIYTQPIPVSSRSGEPNVLSNISTTSPFWRQPEGEVFKASVVRAALFLLDGSRSAIITHSYFIDQNMTSRYSLPIVSLVTDPDYLFDYDQGIYVMGRVWDETYNPSVYPDFWQPANYNQRGGEWERPVSIEFFEPDGQRVLAHDGGVRIHGGWTRSYRQKTLRLYADDQYGQQDLFSVQLFPDLRDAVQEQPITSFKTLLLRNSGNDWGFTMLRDAMMQSLVSHTSLDIQAYRPAILFINGEYWGIHNLRERMDPDYLASHYRVSPEDVIILENNALLDSGIPGDEKHYLQLLEFLSTHHIDDPHIYEYLASQIDMDNYIDYLVTQIYINNTDWPHNNVKFWRYRTEDYIAHARYGQDGRWRWLLFDTDQGFGLSEEPGSYRVNTLKTALYQKGDREWSGFLFRELVNNQIFRELFLNRFSDHLNTTFKAQRVISIIDQMQASIANDMSEHVKRWRTMSDSMDVWRTNIEELRIFAVMRTGFVRQHLMEYFDLSGTAQITLQSDPSMGYIRINSIDITSDTPGVTNPSNWRGIYFQGIPVTISAIPHLGFRFAGWQGSSQQEPSITLIPDQDIILQAVFLPIDD